MSDSLSSVIDAADGNKAADPNAVEVEQLEVAGIVVDKYGNKWQVPGDNVEDFDDLYAPEAYDSARLPKELTEVFELLTVPLSRVEEFAGIGWVAVRVEEMAIPEEVRRMTGKALDSYHVMGDAVLMKLPKKLHEYRQQQKVKVVKRRLAETEPTADMLKAAAESGLHARVEQRHGVTAADPNTRPGVFADNEGKGSMKNG